MSTILVSHDQGYIRVKVQVGSRLLDIRGFVFIYMSATDLVKLNQVMC